MLRLLLGFPRFSEDYYSGALKYRREIAEVEARVSDLGKSFSQRLATGFQKTRRQIIEAGRFPWASFPEDFFDV